MLAEREPKRHCFGETACAPPALRIPSYVAKRSTKPQQQDPSTVETVASLNGRETPAVPKKSATRPRKTPTKTPAKKDAVNPVQPSDEDVRVRAYFISEMRIRISMPGSAEADWIEARRQLLEERSKA